MSQIRRSNPTL